MVVRDGWPNQSTPEDGVHYAQEMHVDSKMSTRCVDTVVFKALTGLKCWALIFDRTMLDRIVVGKVHSTDFILRHLR